MPASGPSRHQPLRATKPPPHHTTPHHGTPGYDNAPHCEALERLHAATPHGIRTRLGQHRGCVRHLELAALFHIEGLDHTVDHQCRVSLRAHPKTASRQIRHQGPWPWQTRRCRHPACALCQLLSGPSQAPADERVVDAQAPDLIHPAARADRRVLPRSQETCWAEQVGVNARQREQNDLLARSRFAHFHRHRPDGTALGLDFIEFVPQGHFGES